MAELNHRVGHFHYRGKGSFGIANSQAQALKGYG